MNFRKSTKLMLFLLALAVTWLVSLGASKASAQIIRVYDKSEFAPTAFHKTVYEMMEACSGVKGDFEGIRWYVAQMILVGNPDLGQQWVGMYNSLTKRITFAREYVFEGWTVSHEALHSLYEGKVPMDIASRCVLDWQRLPRPTRNTEELETP